MADLRFEDIGAILVCLLLVVVVRIAFAYRSEIGQIIAAFWCRYIAFEWRGLPERVADREMGVNHFDQPSGAPHNPTPTHSVTSSQRGETDRRVGVVPSSGTGPDTSRDQPPVLGRNLTERETIALLANQKNGSKWRYSGKKIYSLVGGNHDQFLAIMREIRGETTPDEAPEDLVLTPIAQRPTRATYFEDAPELRYQAPEV